MKFPIKFLVALLALVLGITGILVCVIPHYGPEKVVYDYVAAIEKGDAEKIVDCYATSQLTGMDSSVLDEMSSAVSANLAQLMLNIPKESKVESMDVLGCSVEEDKETLNDYNVTVAAANDEVMAELVKPEGGANIAAVATNVAASLSAKT